MLTFIRIEHPDSGNGIRRHNNCTAIVELSNYDNFVKRHRDFQSIWMELSQYPFNMSESQWSQYYCAFKTVEQLQEWVFQSEIEELISFGFRVYKFEADHCLIGEDQIFFKKEHIISKIDITDIFI